MSEPATNPATASSLHFEYQLSQPEIVEAMRLRLLSREMLSDLFGGTGRRAPNVTRTARALTCLLAGLFVFAVGAAYLGLTVNPVLLVLELLPIATAVLIVVALRKASAAHLRKYEDHPTFRQLSTVQIDARGIRSTRETCCYELDWSGALHLRETAHLTIIVDCEPRAFIIPKRVMTPDQLRELRKLAREHIR
jgi:hypothetical protein